MQCKMNRNAAKVLNSWLEDENAAGKMVRVYVTEIHGDHAHYAVMLDEPTEHDEIVRTDKGVDVLLDTREEFLDGIFIQYFYVPEERFEISNRSKGHPPNLHRSN